MTQCLELARPMVRRRAGLNAHQTWWQLLKECQNRPPLQLTADDHLAASVNGVNLEDKAVFQVHGVDAGGQVVIRRQLKRRSVLAFFQKLPPCLVGIEACASSHHWSRELQALGHTVRLMPPPTLSPTSNGRR